MIKFVIITNLLLSSLGKNVWKSVNNWPIYRQEYSGSLSWL